MILQNYQRLNQVSRPRSSVGRLVLYSLCFVVDLVFVALAIFACSGKLDPVRLWLLVKVTGTIIFRIFFIIEFVDCRLSYLELRNLTLKGRRLKSQVADPFVPGYDTAPLILGLFELTCSFRLLVALMGDTSDRTCHVLTAIAWTSIVLTFLKYAAYIYRSCLQCRRSGPE